MSLVLASAVLAGLIFAIDLFLPLGVAGGVPYIAVVLLGAWFPNPRHTLVLAVVATVLTGLGYFLSPLGGIPWMVATNRGLALFAIWISAVLVVYRKREEARTLVARQQAEIANRAKSELLANMSHELHTPLNAIIGFAHIIKEQTFGPLGHEKYAEYVDDIHASGQHLLELISDILDVSDLESGGLNLHEESLDMSKVIQASVRLIGPRAEAGQVCVSSSVSRDLPRVRADERRVKQILLNLLSNAVKFTPRGGKVTLEAKLDFSGSFIITVADTGIGMTENELATSVALFGQGEETFVRTHGGAGLGLPLTNGLVELHGGVMDIESTKDLGTTVTVRLPKERVIAEEHPE